MIIIEGLIGSSFAPGPASGSSLWLRPPALASGSGLWLPASGSGLWLRPPASGLRLLASNFWLLAFGFRLPASLASGFQLLASGLQLPASGFQPPPSGLWLPASGFQPPASGLWLLAVGCFLIYPFDGTVAGGTDAATGGRSTDELRTIMSARSVEFVDRM